jgi:ABC-2 type transport system ATP-binding protein
MITVQNVSKSFGDFKAVDNVSITVEKGKIYGIIGENGAGKTTLIQALVGVYAIDEGQILIDGENPYENEKLKNRMAYVADRNQFFKGYRIEELVDFFEDVYPHFSREKFMLYNRVFKLEEKRKVRQLSKGMQMRLSLMLNLATTPEVLVLDEPTSGLDAIAKKQILDLIIEEVETRQMTVVISSHHLSELERICDEVTIINEGKVTYQSTVDLLKEKVRKVQVVFKEEVPKNLKQWDEILDVDNIGSVYYIVTKAYTEEFEKRLKEKGAMFIETIGLTLEEIFVYTSRPKGI